MQITLDEMLNDVKEREAKIHESPETLAMLQDAADTLVDMATDSKKIVVLSDYDADGITSAYIIKKAIETINPNCEADVRPNDRRGSYGLSSDTIEHTASLMKENEIDNVIVLDMGTNQIPEIEAHDVYNNHILIIDHHLIDKDKPEIKDKVLGYPAYCNCHAISDNDKDNAQYCTAGLAYRLYELAGCKENAEEKQNNTVLAIAAIGTATDMVDVLDEHSHNRAILKAGVNMIDNATPENFDYVIGYMLNAVKISETTTAHELAFNAGAFLNAGGRMSEIMNENGAARTFAALTAPEDKVSTFREIDELQFINNERKHLVSQITSSPEYIQQLENEKFGANREADVAVVTLPSDTPHSFAGLVAAKFEEAADKAVICLTQNSETGYWSGSARNPDNSSFSLIDFMRYALENTDIDIKYGGHSNALGISSLKDEDFHKFVTAIAEKQTEFITHDEKTIERGLTIPVSEFASPDAIQKVKALEPTGIGLQLPSVKFEGVEQKRNMLFKAGRKDWKTVRIKQEGVVYDVADWSYDERAYPQGGKKGNEIELTAEVGLSNYRGEHIEFTAKFNRTDFLEKVKELEITAEPVKESNEKDDMPNI